MLVQLVESNNIITYVACNLRFHPCIIYLRNILSKNILIINEVNVYCGSYLPDWRPGVNIRTIYSSNPNMGGGVHLDLFHELDYTVWLFGHPKVSKSFLRSASSLNIDSIDYANYILEYNTFNANIILNYFRRKPWVKLIRDRLNVKKKVLIKDYLSANYWLFGDVLNGLPAF